MGEVVMVKAKRNKIKVVREDGKIEKGKCSI